VEKIDKILIECIEDIKSGRATLPDCLARHEASRHELEPLLRLALNIREPVIMPLDGNAKQNIKTGLLQQISTAKQPKSRSFVDIFSLGVPARFVWARVAVTVIVIVVIISLMGGGTAYAAQDSLPGDLLYPVKTGTEDARILLAAGNSAKAELNLQFARTRLEEMSRLSTRSEEKTALALNGYRENLYAAGEEIDSITNPASLSNVLGLALQNMDQQTAYSDHVIDSGAAYLGPVREANALSVQTQVQLLRILEKQDIVGAAQSNINAMQNRLQRAFSKAGEDRFQVMQQVLLQYQQFSRLGEEILERAQNMNDHTAEVEALNSEALPGYLDTLDNMYLHAPQEYRNTIQACRELTLQTETQARYRYQGGAGDDITPPAGGDGHGPGPGGQLNPQDQSGSGNTGNVTQNTTPAPSPDKGPNMGGGSGPVSDNVTGQVNGSGSGSGNMDGAGPGPNTGPGPDAGSGGGTGSGGSTGGDTGSGGSGSGGDAGSGGGGTGGADNGSGGNGSGTGGTGGSKP
jgi:uncharacterized membrane protein YgcG